MSTSTTEQVRMIGREALVKQRMSKNLSLNEISKTTKIPERYLKLFEEKEHVAKDAYTSLYLKAYCKFLGIDYASCAETLTESKKPPITSHQSLVTKNNSPIIRHPKTAVRIIETIAIAALGRKAIFGAITLAVAGYIGWTLYAIIAPPKLTLTSPSASSITTEQRVTIEGRAAAESTITINGKVVPVDNQGVFRDHIDLAIGSNTISVSAKKKYSKPTIIKRDIVVTPQ
jgi:cytoskeletal protein RodZ